MRVWSVDPCDPFLPTLAARLVDGTLWPTGTRPDHPLALADVTVYLPTRRAARALATAFLDLAPGAATALPRIEALGDGEDEFVPRTQVMGPLEARVVLAELVRRFAGELERAADAEPGARLLVPSAGADAVRLADALLALMDQVETQEADWTTLPGLVERADLAEHWQITTDFLRIATQAWPQHLAQIGKITGAAARRSDAEAAIARVSEAPGPIIVAGSTGSIPATRRLIAAIARSPAGAVVLPGFDRDATADDWRALAQAEDGPGHPQYGMKQLVDALDLAPEAVRRLSPPTPARAPADRTALLAAALRPAAATGAWRQDHQRIAIEEALAGVTWVEAADEREEAAAIAVAMRESVALGQTVALVTPHRALARRVRHALRRWRIDVDDSAGEPLAATPAAVLARLLASVASGAGAAEWLALLKHPAASFGLEPAVRERGVRATERLMRRRRLAPHSVLAALTAADEAAAALAGPVGAVLAPLLAIAGTASVAQLAAAHRAVFAAAAPTLASPDAAALAEALDALALRDELTVPAGDWPATFEALIEGFVVRAPPREDAVRILGPLEARLQAFDHAVLGGLNEGTWPALPDAGPWMSRGMMSAFGIDLPERRIGLSAHDFVMAAHQPRVTLTRARKAAGEPTVASRWWLRVAAFTGSAAQAARARGTRLLALAAALEERAPTSPAPRPQPAPPVALRPTRISVTEVARLVRDPYAVYARRVLGLVPLDPLDPDPGAGDRGELVHALLARFIGGGHHRGGDALARFHALLEEALATLRDAPEAQAVWGARLRHIAGDIVAHEAARGDLARRSLVEVEAEMALPDGQALTGRIDRIDVAADGSLEVIDYKTGKPPSAREVAAFLEPQLPLEAALVRGGAVAGAPAEAPLRALSYVALGAGRVPVAWMAVGGDEPPALATEALARLVGLLARYRDPTAGYLSRARVQFADRLDGDYDHLARAAEWHGA